MTLDEKGRVYQLDLRHRARFGTERVFVTVKPKWGPYRTKEMHRLTENVFRADVELRETERYQFHEVPTGPRTNFVRHMIGYSLRDQMLKKNPINFSADYPFLESIGSKRYVRVETLPELFRRATLRLYTDSGELDLSQDILEFAEWEVPKDLVFREFRFIFENDRQRVCWPGKDAPPYAWPGIAESEDHSADGAGLVLQLAPETSFVRWLEQLQEFGALFDSILCPPFLLSIPGSSYQVVDYLQVNPLLGSAEELQRVFDWSKSNGKKLILDMPFRFCAHLHDWARSGEKSFFERDENGCLKYWAMNTACLLLDWSSAELQEELLHILKHWQERSGAWGFRIDCAHEIQITDYLRFLKRARALGQCVIYGESWDIVSLDLRVTNYYLPIFMQHHSQGWETPSILHRLLRKFLFDTGYSFSKRSLGYFSSHDTKFLQIPEQLYVAYFFLALFLPGSRVCYVHDLETVLRSLDLSWVLGAAREFSHCPLEFQTTENSVTLVRGNWLLTISSESSQNEGVLQLAVTSDQWLRMERR